MSQVSNILSYLVDSGNTLIANITLTPLIVTFTTLLSIFIFKNRKSRVVRQLNPLSMDNMLGFKTISMRIFSNLNTTQMFGMLCMITSLHVFLTSYLDAPVHSMFVFFECTISAFLTYDLFLHRYIFPIRETVSDFILGWRNDVNKNTFASIVKGWNDHKVGIALCVNTAINCDTYTEVMHESLKIGSFLNLERSIISSISTKVIDTLSGNKIKEIITPNLINNTAIDSDKLRKIMPTIATAATLAGAEILDVNATGYMNNFAKNLKNSQTILDHVLKVTDELNITKNSIYDKLEDITKSIVSIEEDSHWFKNLLVANGSSLLHQANSRRVENYLRKVEDITRSLRIIETSKLNNNKIVTDAGVILKECKENILQYEAIKNTNGIRPAPVGVTIKGVTGIGKTTLVNACLVPKIKRALLLHPKGPRLFGPDIASWQTWNYNARDEYDSNYSSQEIVYHDDAWQAKDNKDHEMYFSWMGSSIISMNMSDNNQKGRPFKSLLVIQTCNQYPEKSSKIFDIKALQRRFPICIEAEKIREPTEYDPEFNHIIFRTATMTEFVEAQGASKNSNLKFGIQKNIDNIVLKIVEQLITNMETYEMQKVEIRRIEEQIVERSDPEDQPGPSRVSGGELFEVRLRPLTSTIETQTINLNEIKDIVEQYNSLNRAPAVTIPTLQQIENLMTNHTTDLNRVLSNVTHTCQELYRPDGSTWMDYLVKFEDGIEVVLQPQRFENLYVSANENDAGCDRLYQLLSQLGAWKIKEGKEMEFLEALGRQPSVRCMDRFGTVYWWGAPFNNYKSLIPDCPQSRTALQTRANTASASDVVQMYMGNMTWFQRVATTWVLKSITSGPIMIFATIRWNGLITWAPDRLFWGDQPQIHWRVLHNTVSIINSPLYITNKAFDNFKKLSDKFSNKIIVMILKLLEYFGLDVDGFWRTYLERQRVVIEEVVLISLLAMLSMLLYQLIIKFFNQNKQIQEAAYETTPKHIGTKITAKLPLIKNRCSENSCILKNTKDGYITTPKGEKHWVSIIEKECGSPLPMDYWWFDPTDRAQGSDRTGTIDGTLYGHGIEETWDSEFAEVKKNEVTYENRKIYHNDKSQSTLIIKFSSVGNYDDTQTNLMQYYKIIETLNLYEWKLKHQTSHDHRDSEQIYHVYLELTCLTTKIQDKIVRYTRAEIQNICKNIDDIMGIRSKTTDTVSSVFNNITDIINEKGNDAPAKLSVIKRKHSVWLNANGVSNLDSPSSVRLCWGIGHHDRIYSVAHVWELNEIVRYSPSPESMRSGYNVAQVVFIDSVRDISVMQILNKQKFYKYLEENKLVSKCNNLMSYTKTFPSLIPHLIDSKDYLNYVNKSEILVKVMNADSNERAVVDYQGQKDYISIQYGPVKYDVLKARCNNAHVVKGGDCGSPVVTNNRRDSRFIGMIMGNIDGHIYINMLSTDDLNIKLPVINNVGSISDDFLKLIVPGKPTDLPYGEDVEFVGVYIGNNKPVSDMSLSHWKYSPMSDEFEEQMQPAPLSPHDARIIEDVPTNREGKKSLLVKQNSIMCSKLPDINVSLVNDIVTQLSAEYSLILSDIRRTPEDIDEAINEGINGNVNNLHCTNMELNKSAGIPYVENGNLSKKSDYLDNNEGVITFKNDKNGQNLKTRIKNKLCAANNGQRLISISSSKLKDSVIKISAVKKGKTRIFHCIPVCKIISDSTLFSNFKEAYVDAGLHLNHAIGSNPHSLKWRDIKDKINIHPNCFDIDYAEYDKRIHRVVMDGAYNIIRNVINTNVPDKWDKAREILQLESSETYVLDYNTCYKTKHGLKSGEYLTSVIGCIVNDIQFAYCFAQVFDGNFDIAEYRKNVSLVTYGDDVIASVSNEIEDKFNYFTVKEQLEKIGHVITPGNKDGVESKFVSIDDLVFLKRNFVDYKFMTIAPLSKRSIESPFVYTQIPESDVEIWKNLMEQQLDEAVLWGKDYYEEVRNKLRKCRNKNIISYASTILSETYENKLKKYEIKYAI